MQPGSLKNFLDNSKDGAVIISFGSIAKVSILGMEIVKKFLQVFHQLSCLNFIWGIDKEIEEIPKNLMILKWLPLADVLAHENVKLLISHGGIFSAYEAIDREIPMIIFPFAFDQATNAKMMTKNGIAVEMDINEFTSEQLEMKIVEMMKSEKREKVKNLKSLMKDNSTKEVLISSVEFLIRNKNNLEIYRKTEDKNIFFTFISIFLISIMKLLTFFWS